MAGADKCDTLVGPRKDVLKDAINGWPIIFASIHGVYDLRVELQRSIVPGNAIFIEVADIGDVTYTTIDPLLWELIQNRELLRDLIWTIARPLPAELQKYEQVLKVLHVYLPGDEIYSRNLIYEESNEYDSGWSIYRFMAGGGGGGGGPPATTIPFPAAPSRKTMASYTTKIAQLQAEGITDPFLQKIKYDRFSVGSGPTLKSGKVLPLRGRDTSYSQFRLMEDCNKNYGAVPTIYFISACAALWTNEEDKATFQAQDERYTAVFDHQRKIDIRNYECGIKKLAFQGNSPGTISLSLEQLGRPKLREGKSSRPNAGSGFFASSIAYGSSVGVTGPTSENAAILARGTATRAPPTTDFDGPTVLLFIKIEQDGTYIYDTIMPPGGGTNPEWRREHAMEFATRNPGAQLFTIQRGYDQLPKLVPFTGGGRAGGRRRTRRFKRTRKVKRVSRRI